MRSEPNPIRNFTTPPTAAELAALAEKALRAIPAHLAQHVQNVAIMVEEMPDDATLAELEIESPWDLTGLYRGIPMIGRSIQDIARPPDIIVLYRQPILLEWIETEENLFRLVRNVLIHEIAHHFGFSDEEIDRLERDPG